MIKVDKNLLRDYIAKVSLNSTILTLNLNFEEHGLTTKVANTENIAMVLGELKKEGFLEYEAIGEIFIKNSTMFLNLIKTFQEVITIEKIEDNVIRLKDDTREVNIMLAEEKICGNVFRRETPKIETTATVVVNKSFLIRAVNDMGLLGVSSVTFDKKGDKLILGVGAKEYDFIENNMACSGEENARVMLGEVFKDLVAIVGQEVTLHIGNDLPVVVDDNTEFINVQTLLAPKIENVD